MLQAVIEIQLARLEALPDLTVQPELVAVDVLRSSRIVPAIVVASRPAVTRAMACQARESTLAPGALASQDRARPYCGDLLMPPAIIASTEAAVAWVSSPWSPLKEPSPFWVCTSHLSALARASSTVAAQPLAGRVVKAAKSSGTDNCDADRRMTSPRCQGGSALPLGGRWPIQFALAVYDDTLLERCDNA